MTSRIRLQPLGRAFIAGITLLVTPGIALPVPLPISTPPRWVNPADDLGAVATSLPAGTLAFFAVPSIPVFRQQFVTSGLYQIFAEPQVRKFLEKPLALLKAGSQSMPAGFDSKVLDDLFDGPVVIALTSVRLPKPGSADAPDIGIVAYAKGASAERLASFRSMLTQLGQSNPQLKIEKRTIADVQVDVWSSPGAPVSLEIAQLGDRLFVSPSHSTLESMLQLAKGKGASLTSDATYQKVAKGLAEAAPILSLYVNIEGILGLFQGLIPGPARNALEKSGVTGFKAFGLSTAVRDGMFVDTSYLCVPQPRTGVQKCLDTDPVDLSHLSVVPKDSIGFGIHRMNIAPLWDAFWGAAEAYDSEAAGHMKKELTVFEKELGFALKQDFLDTLGDELIYYSKASITGIPEFGCYLSLKNVQKFGESVQKLTAKIPGLKLKEIPVGDAKAYYVDLAQLGPMAGFVQPSYGFAGNYLVFSLNLQAVKSAIAGFSAKDRQSVLENEEFKALLAGIPKGVTGLDYTDTRRSFESTYNMARNFLPFITMSAGKDLPVDLALLPTADVFTKHLAAGISYDLTDADGCLSRSKTSISAALIVPVVVLAVGAGVLVGQRMR